MHDFREEELCEAVILAAGKGSRLEEADSIKPLIMVGNKPLICHVIDNLIYAGIKKIGIIKYQYDSFEVLKKWYREKEVNLYFIDDRERKGSLYTFSKAEAYVKNPFICADCDLIAEPAAFKDMILKGKKIMQESACIGLTAKVLCPSRDDKDMIMSVNNKAVNFLKTGVKNGVRGGYIYIWKKEVFLHCKEFFNENIYSLSGYLNFIMGNYEVGFMDIVDMWDIDTLKDITDTNRIFTEKNLLIGG